MPVRVDVARSPWPLVMAVVGVATMILSAPFIARASREVLSAESQTPLEWVPQEFPSRAEYDRFSAEFGSGNVVVATWPGCTLGSPAVARVVEAAEDPVRTSDPAGRRWFSSVTDGDTVLTPLLNPPLSLSRSRAIDRISGMLVGPDRHTTCVVFAFTPEGISDRRRAVNWIRDVIRRTATTDEDSIHLAGPVVDHTAVDAASKESLERFAPAAAAIVLLLTWWSLRSLRYALIVFGMSMWCVGLSFTTLWLWGDRMNAVLIVMPALVLVLGVSAGIHLVNYLMEAAADSPHGVARRAVTVGWLPCLLSAGTTAVGLASLVVSELEPIRTFGFHAAIAVMATLLTSFTVLPGLFERWPIRPSAPAASAEASISHLPVARRVIAHATLIVIAFLAVMAATGAGIPGIRTSVRIDTLFQPHSRIIRDYTAVERAIGPLVPIEVVLTFDAECDSRPFQRLDLVKEVGERLVAATGAAQIMSAVSFAPEVKGGGRIADATAKASLARGLTRNLASLDEMRYVRNTPDGQLWRITARISALDDVDYGRLLDRVRAEVMPLLTPENWAYHEVRATFTGVMPVVHGIQNTLLSDLFTSFLSACGIITLVMMLAQRSVLAGIVAMMSNVFPMILLFGFLGWAKVPLDIGSVMTASIALGMAIDGTLHFLTFYRRAIIAGADQNEAVMQAFQHSAAALTQSSIDCGVGIPVFALSSFAPTSRFAGMLALLVAAECW
ncbi:MAG: efflux RND transporter permease subunit, partial [Planctomycetaceae bacterium]